MEGDSVTLNSNVKKTIQEMIRWKFNDTRIAEITGDQSYICTDVQCNEGTERFRDRLKLDHQTGSLTITNTRNTDSGLYILEIFSSGKKRKNIFIVSFLDVSAAAERDKVKRKSVKKGESVTLYTFSCTPNLMMWYFNDTLFTDITWYFNNTCVAEITRDQSKICTDVQCKERFGDRLKLDHQTGSLILTNLHDSGVYTLKINNIRFSIRRRYYILHYFPVTDPYVPSNADIYVYAAIVVVCNLLMVSLVTIRFITYFKKEKRKVELPQSKNILTTHQ